MVDDGGCTLPVDAALDGPLLVAVDPAPPAAVVAVLAAWAARVAAPAPRTEAATRAPVAARSVR